jgi:hypothetical protein
LSGDELLPGPSRLQVERGIPDDNGQNADEQPLPHDSPHLITRT